jgi:long-subunit acyl-CoA synthetase (AMP-forming)
MKNIFDDIQAAGPTTLAATPRFYNVLYAEYMKDLEVRLAHNLVFLSNAL